MKQQSVGSIATPEFRSSMRPLRALYVEDNTRDAKLYSHHLEKAGFVLQADAVTTAEEFLQAVRSASYDIILADYRLPTWSGIEALEALQREGKSIPLILVSGTVDDEVAVECIKKGATDYILKDRLARLSHAVQRALDEKASREARMKAERSRDLLAAIVESSDDAIIGVTLDGTILTWNRGAIRIYGYSIEEVQGKPLSLLFAPDNAEELGRSLAALKRFESVDRYETAGVRKDGVLIDIAVTMSPIPDPDGRSAGGSAIIREITDHKRLQKEFFHSQKMEAIGRLAAGVAHDFNNLLTVVTGYSSLVLAKLREDDPLYAEISEISKAGERAASLTRQLLIFSRRQVVQSKVLDLNAIVAEMDRMLRRVIGEDIDLVTVLDRNLGPVKADPGQMEQIIMNLAVNARDAMPSGGKLTIETANIELQETIRQRHLAVSPGAYAILAITDTGIGMDLEIQERIFEPFFTTKPHGEGTGLGLSTVYGIVERCGGTILVYSEPGRGTTFKIYLPRVQDQPEQPRSSIASSSPGGSETILVVEDEDGVRTLVCQVLEKQGYKVMPARNGDEALVIGQHHRQQIDLMITDVIMPSMSGSELANRLKVLRPKMSVLFMSGYTDNAIAHQDVLRPDTAFLEKPFEPQVLARKVREVLDQVEH